MRRIQIHLEEELDEALARDALARNVSKAALIREYLARHVAPERHTDHDPAEGLIGAYDGSAAESASVDEVVYGK